MKPLVLLTGFEPFNKEPINPSWETVRALDGWSEDGFDVVVRQMPCVFGDALEVLRREVDDLKPAAVIAVGQAGGRTDLSVERVAINVDDAPIKDNADKQLIDAPVVPDGPAAYFSTLPIKSIVAAMRAQGLPASVSQTAGTFVCNHLFYGLMDLTAGSQIKAGFIHIPYLPEQATRFPGAPSMSLADMVRGIRIAVQTTMNTATDLSVAGGQTH